MTKALRRLADLQARLAKGAEDMAIEMEGKLPDDLDPELVPRVSIASVAGGVHLDYFGSPFDEPFAQLLEAITTPEVSAVLASLSLRGPDEGGNGTRYWDLTPLAETDQVFPRLRSLFIEQTRPADHNQSIVAADYEEAGVLAKILSRAPAMDALVTPSAPDADFFRVGQRPLNFLSVDTGYDSQAFIRNLAQSTCFPHLRCFEFGEYTVKSDGDREPCTPFQDYEKLFESDAFKPVMRFVWRNPACSAADCRKLASMRPGLQLLVVRTSAEYVNPASK